MISSMTGFASGKGSFAAHSWSWELRAVNGKGQDIRIRVPDWITGLETHLRNTVAEATARGHITIGLRLAREEASAALSVNTAQLDAVLAAMAEVEQRAMDQHLSLQPSTSSQILGLRGILEQSTTEDDPAPLLAALKADFAPVLASFNEMRASEGAQLEALITSQIDEIERLTNAAAEAAEARREESAAAFRASLAEKSVPTAVYYPVPLHLQDCYAAFKQMPGGLPVTEAAAHRVVSLPMDAYLEGDRLSQVIAAVRASV